MPFFRKKPVVIEAMRFDGTNHSNVAAWCGAASDGSSPVLVIATLEGNMVASVGDWIICGVNGEFYPCKPDIFDKTYELVDNG